MITIKEIPQLSKKGFPSDSPSKEVKSIDSGAHTFDERDTAWNLLSENGFVKGEMENFELSRQFTQIVDSNLRRGESPAEALAKSVFAFAPATTTTEQATLCTLISNIIEQDNPQLHRALEAQLTYETKRIPQSVIDSIMARADVPNGLHDALSRIKKLRDNV